MLKPSQPVGDDNALEDAIAAVATAMADASRVKMLCALMDGRAWTATELGAVADIASSTASAHLARLVKGHLITCLSQGRHRYYRLAGQDISALIESMMGVSWKRVDGMQTRTPLRLRYARTCYDHLAGEVAVSLYDALIAGGWLEADGAALTTNGVAHFRHLGIALNPTSRRKACCACLDWSERRFHLGGDAGAALLLHCEHKGWLARTPGFREVTITASGRLALKNLFNVDA